MSLSREFELNTKTQDSALKMFNKAYKLLTSKKWKYDWPELYFKKKIFNIHYLKYLKKFIGTD